jgi:hypothetical protein
MLLRIFVVFMLGISCANAQVQDSTRNSGLLGIRFFLNGLSLSGGLGAKYWLNPQA